MLLLCNVFPVDNLSLVTLTLENCIWSCYNIQHDEVCKPKKKKQHEKQKKKMTVLRT